MSEEATELSDPLSDVIRKQKRSLLLVSAIGIAIVQTGLVPTKISALLRAALFFIIYQTMI